MARDFAFDSVEAAVETQCADKTAKSIWRRMYDHMIASRHAAASRQVEIYIKNHGGLLTDELERDISRKYGRIVGQ